VVTPFVNVEYLRNGYIYYKLVSTFLQGAVIEKSTICCKSNGQLSTM